jgi:putative ABC transport system permease protein
MNEVGLRQLYQLNDETTGAVQIYLKDIGTSPQVLDVLRKTLVAGGYTVMDRDDRPFWQKFDSVNREDWTGQRLDLTTWEGEVSFMKWILDGVSALFFAVILVMMIVIEVGIGMVMWVTIRERTREIGTLRAIGMQATRVLAMFTIEGFLIGLAGTVSGVAGGLALAAGLNSARVSFPGMQVVLLADHLVVTPTVFWSVFSIVVITSLITLVSLVPSFIAARLSPIDAMSHIG